MLLKLFFGSICNLRYLYVSPAIEGLSGMCPAHFLGKGVLDFGLPFYDPNGLAMNCREAIATGRSVQREFCVQGKEYRTQLIPELADDGTVQSLLGIAEDITARKRIEVALQQTQDQYYSLLQSIDDIVWELDYETWRFTFVSKRAERLLGYPIECWLDEPSFWPDHLHPEDRDRTLEKCVYLSERNQNHELEYRMIRADGQIVWFRDVVTVEQRDGRTFRLRGIMLDITDSKEEEAFAPVRTGYLR